VQDWETNIQSSIPNTKTLNVKPPKKAQRYEPKKNIYIACLEPLVLFSMLLQ
jgi:hypothetical protein